MPSPKILLFFTRNWRRRTAASSGYLSTSGLARAFTAEHGDSLFESPGRFTPDMEKLMDRDGQAIEAQPTRWNVRFLPGGPGRPGSLPGVGTAPRNQPE